MPVAAKGLREPVFDEFAFRFRTTISLAPDNSGTNVGLGAKRTGDRGRAKRAGSYDLRALSWPDSRSLNATLTLAPPA
jgi:hypothetical protein